MQQRPISVAHIERQLSLFCKFRLQLSWQMLRPKTHEGVAISELNQFREFWYEHLSNHFFFNGWDNILAFWRTMFKSSLPMKKHHQFVKVLHLGCTYIVQNNACFYHFHYYPFFASRERACNCLALLFTIQAWNADSNVNTHITFLSLQLPIGVYK